jgi:predicted HNH restriction endonuclease
VTPGAELPSSVSPAPSKLAQYKAFVAATIASVGGRCECCGRTAQEARQPALHCHHLWSVAKSGIADALVMARCNVLVVCHYCHRLQHTGQREWAWDSAGMKRGMALR